MKNVLYLILLVAAVAFPSRAFSQFVDAHSQRGERPLGISKNHGPRHTDLLPRYETWAGQEINVQGNGLNISDGDITPNATDGTSFGTVIVGASNVSTFTIQNTGTGDLAVASISVTGTGASHYAVGALTPASPIAPGASATFTVTFSPTSTGVKSATITILNDDANESIYNFEVEGTGCTLPVFGSCPSNISTNIAGGACTQTVTYTATATGAPNLNRTYAFTGATTGNGSGSGSGASFNIGTTNVEVTATTDCGSTTCAFTITINAPEIDVLGNGVSIVDGDATPSAADHTNFGSITIAGGTVVRTFTISNTGTSSLTINSITRTGGNTGDFTIGTLTPASPIAAGASSTFTVTFDPSAIGVRSTTIRVSADECNEGTYTYAIEGTGIAPNQQLYGIVNNATYCSGTTGQLVPEDWATLVSPQLDLTVTYDNGVAADNFTVTPVSNNSQGLLSNPNNGVLTLTPAAVFTLRPAAKTATATIYYKPDGATNTDTVVAVFYRTPVISLANNPLSVNEDDAPFSVTTATGMTIPPAVNQWNLVYSGPSLTGATFDPSIGPGSYNIQAFAFHPTYGGCFDNESVSINVAASLVPRIEDLNGSFFCNGESIVANGENLTGSWLVTFVGSNLPDVTVNGTANSITVPIPNNQTPLTQVVTLRFVNAAANRDTTLSDVVQISPSVAVIGGLGNSYCFNADTVLLLGAPNTGTFTPPSLFLARGTGYALFLPSTETPDTYTITYTASVICNSGPTTLTTSQQVTINPSLINSIDFIRDTFTIGIGQDPVPLFNNINTISPNTPLALSGHFSGPLVSRDTLFVTNLLTPGTYPVYYTVTDGAGNCTQTIQNNIVIRPNLNNNNNTVPGLLNAYCDSLPIRINLLSLPDFPNNLNQNCDVWVYYNNNLIQSLYYQNISPPQGSTFNLAYAGNGTYTLRANYWDGPNTFLTSRETTFNVVTSCNLVGLPAGTVCPYAAPFNVFFSPPADSVFIDNAPVALANPILLSPAILGPGTHTIDYYRNGVLSTEMFTIGTPVTPTLTGLNNRYCQGSPTLDTITVSPAGGQLTITGTGSIGYSQLTPSTWLLLSYNSPGTVNFTYTVTNSGCTYTATATTTIVAPEQASFALNTNVYCEDALPVPLSGQPAGGVFTGLGVLNNVFRPSQVNAASTVIIYRITDGNGCQDTVQFNVQIRTRPSLNISGLVNSYCPNNAATIQAFGAPQGGRFSLDGQALLPVGNYSFVPANLPANTPHILRYVYADNGNVCVDTTSFSFNITSNVNLVLPNPQTVCRNGANINLTATPSGGVFTGQGVSLQAPYTFQPGLAQNGANMVIYSYTQPGTGCVFRDTTLFTVVDPVQSTFDLASNIYCEDALPEALTGLPTGGVFSGPGVANNTFYPANVNAASAVIVYTVYDNNGCLDTSQFNVQIRSRPYLSITGLVNNYCPNNGNTVTAVGSPPGGGFSFNGQPPLQGNYSFVPQNLQPNQYSLQYIYSDNGNVCTDTVGATFNISPVVALTLPPSQTICSNAAPIVLNATPAGGIFTGSGVSLQAPYTFQPALAQIGLNKIYYTYTQPVTGCVFRDSVIFSVVSPVQSFFALNSNVYCEDALPISLTGQPAGGTFSGPGVTNNIFYPANVNAASAVIVYTVFDNNGCLDTSHFNVQIRTRPNVNISGLLASYCPNSADTAFIFGVPSGGQFSLDNQAPINGNYSFVPKNFPPNTPHSLRYVYADNGNVCIDTAIASFNISAIVPLTLPLPQTRCRNAQPTALTATPSGGVFSGQGVSAQPPYTFQPSLGATGANPIIYTYTQPVTGCVFRDTVVFTVVDPPTPDILTQSPFASFCQGGTDVLTAQPLGGQYLWSTGATTPSITISQPGDYYMTVTSGVCTVVDSIDVGLYNLPVVFITNLNPSYCKNGDPIVLQANQLGGTFDLYNTQFGLLEPDINLFDPNVHAPGVYNLTFRYTDGNNCTNRDTISFELHDLPLTGYTQTGKCIGDQLSFTDTSRFAIPNIFNDSIVSRNWLYMNFADGNITTVHPSPTAGPYTLRLSLETSAGCVVELPEANLFLGDRPRMDFTFSGGCGNEAVAFVPTSEPLATGETADTLFWNFGVAGGTFVDATGNLLTATRVYNTPNLYTVTLTAKTERGCADTVSRLVPVVPKVSTYPYTQTFDANTGNWVDVDAGDKVGLTWEWNTIPGRPGKSWQVKPVGGSYPANADGWVYGPCFDLTSLDRPMVSLNISDSTQSGYDGSVLEYSLDGGATWRRIGGQETGKNWYDFFVVAGPGDDPLPLGWTGGDGSWKTARHKLDAFKSQTKFRVRLAFASDGTNPPAPNPTLTGFSFDDFFVGERKKTLLVEHFANTQYPNMGGINTGLYNLLNNVNLPNNIDNPQDVALVQYHIPYPTGDAIYNQNPADPGARALYYGVNQPASALLDGIPQHNGNTSQLVQNDLDLAMLEDPKFKIELNPANIGVGQVNVTSTVTALSAFAANVNLSLKVAVLEDAVQGNYGVLRKLLPDASGTDISRNWVPNDAQTYFQSWTFNPGIYFYQNMEIVAFVQNDDTKEVYQVATTQENVPWTSLEEAPEEHFNLQVYPNPASDILNIGLLTTEQGTWSWALFDVVGQKLQEGEIGVGTTTQLPLSDLAPGLYGFVLYKEGQLAGIRKVLIVK